MRRLLAVVRCILNILITAGLVQSRRILAAGFPNKQVLFSHQGGNTKRVPDLGRRSYVHAI